MIEMFKYNPMWHMRSLTQQSKSFSKNVIDAKSNTHSKHCFMVY